MGALYLDTSALGKVLLDEPGAPMVLRELGDHDAVVSSWLLRLELRRLALRHGVIEAADELLRGVALAPLAQGTLRIAETTEPRGVASLDAIHLATAVQMRRTVDAVMTYDRDLARGAEHHGLAVLAPR